MTAYGLRISDWSSDVFSSDLLIERWLSPAVMLETARMFLIDPAGREQRHYAPYSPATAHGDAAVRAAQTWLDAQYASVVRSEGRRDGKECVSPSRSRWSAEH